MNHIKESYIDEIILNMIISLRKKIKKNITKSYFECNCVSFA